MKLDGADEVVEARNIPIACMMTNLMIFICNNNGAAFVFRHENDKAATIGHELRIGERFTCFKFVDSYFHVYIVLVFVEGVGEL